MPTRDLSNKRITLWLGLASAVADFAKPTIAEINALKMISPAVRWDGFDLGSQAADSTDDRSLDDEAGATIAGFMQFGGAMPFFYPKKSDTASILRQVYNILKTVRQDLVVVERVGYKSTSDPIAAGDNVNVYHVMNDSFAPDTEGDGGYAYVVGFLPQGDVYPWTIVPDTTPGTVAIVGGATLSLSLAGVKVGLRGATYLGNNIGNRATWVSSDPTKATVDNHGVIVGIATGTTNVTATFPGGTTSTPVAVTVAA